MILWYFICKERTALEHRAAESSAPPQQRGVKQDGSVPSHSLSSVLELCPTTQGLKLWPQFKPLSLSTGCSNEDVSIYHFYLHLQRMPDVQHSCVQHRRSVALHTEEFCVQWGQSVLKLGKCLQRKGRVFWSSVTYSSDFRDELCLSLHYCVVLLSLCAFVFYVVWILYIQHPW